MRYTEFKLDRYHNVIRAKLTENYNLSEVSDETINRIANVFAQSVKKNLGKNPSVDDILNLLKDNNKVKDFLQRANIGPDVIAKAMRNTTQPADSEPSKETPKSSTSDATNNEQITKAMMHLNREVEGPDAHKDMLTKLHAAALEKINNGQNAEAIDLLKSKLKEINTELANLKAKPVTETASGGSTGAGSVASVNAPLGAVIRRMPPGQSFFAPVAEQTPKKTSKKAKMLKKRTKS